MKQTILSIAALLTTCCQARHAEKRIQLLRIRAGAASEEDEILDAYINLLIASIDGDSNETGSCIARESVGKNCLFENFLDEGNVIKKEEENAVEERNKMVNEYQDTATKFSVEAEVAHVAEDNQANDDQEIVDDSTAIVVSRSVDKKLKVTAHASALDMLLDGSAEQEVQPAEVGPETKVPLATRAMKRKKQIAVEYAPVSTESTHAESTSETSTEISAPPRPPNVMYHFLLNHGRLGHIIVMICVWISEFIQTYFPQLATFMAWIASIILPASSSHRGGGPYIPPKKVNEQYTGFVSTDGTSVRGKKNQAATKKADQKAVEQLRRIGSVKEAMYRHVSVNFMKRYVFGLTFEIMPFDMDLTF
jgi:hypothetical protein